MVSPLSGARHGSCAGSIPSTGWSTIRRSFLSFPRRCRNKVPPVPSFRCDPAVEPLAGADLLLLFPNKTWKRATTDEQGEAAVDLHTTQLPLSVFAAAPGHAAHLERDWTPVERALAIDLDALPEGGSVILPEATGHLPGLKGRLNPIRDTHDRTYLYASNIVIDEGKQQPVQFIPGEELQLTDAEGTELRVRIVDIVGRSALVE